jgi:pimeloyl-ACP methyl ester carboxylesterase
MSGFDLQRATIHGHDVAYRTCGSGPVLVLIHGMAGSSSTWRFVAPRLAEHFTIVAPDLPGHGHSSKPRGDYSVGALASAIRDLLVALGHERATLVGQSLGGGVAMQFAYQFPERSERLVLVSSGGLGQEVNLLLRVLSLPGAEYVLPLVCTSWIHRAGTSVADSLRTIGFVPSAHLTEIWESYGSLADGETRTAFVNTLRSVIDAAGQRVSALDKLYLASAAVPTLIIWGGRDSIIPVQQGHATHELMPGSRLEVFDGVGHFPHCEQPDRFADVLVDFVRSTEPASVSPERWRELINAAQTR